MTDNLIAFFYRERLLVAVVSMLIVAGGILALRRLNVDAFPDVTPVQVEIDTEAQGLAPEEIERQITFPIENEMNGISGVTRVESLSKFGLSVVVVYFNDDTDIYFARQQVFERLSSAKDRIPSGFQSSGDSVVSRENSLRRAVVMCNVKGRDIGSFVHDAQQAVALQVKTPPGYFVTWGGQFENEQQAVRRLLIAIPIALLLVFVLIYSCFNSLRNTLTIIFNIPIALVGSTTFLLISGFPLSVPAIVGFIAVFGIAVQNGMVMVSFINKLRSRGYDLHEAVITGASVRLRAELLSALIGSIRVRPFIISSGTGAEIEKTLAIVVVGGVVTRPIKIVVLPMVYEWVERGATRREKAGLET